MQVPILSGIYADGAPDLRVALPRNMMPVPLDSGISKGYLRPADGIASFGMGPGIDRGGINWNGTMYRVMGSHLVRVDAAGMVTHLGDVGPGGQVTMDYSFDRLAIASGGRLYYWDGAVLTQVTDEDLGTAVDLLWVDGYWMTTDGVSLVVTELNDPLAVDPLKYGSSEVDPDPVKGLIKLRGEVYALNRYSIEVFRNIGGSNFPFQRIEGAMIPRGAVGTHACNLFLGAIAFIGSARNEAPAVWLAGNGDTAKLSTREIDTILGGYTESQLADVVMESRVDKGHQHLWIHLPDQVLVYDGAASRITGSPVWFTLTTSLVGTGTLRARNLVWCYDKWLTGDPTSGSIGTLVSDISSHFGQANGWDFGTLVLYNEGRGAVVHDMELVSLTGRVTGDPVIWASHSDDGQTWSQERPTSAGKQGDRMKRIAWRGLGRMQHWRVQRFRGTSDAHVSVVRLEVNAEALDG